VGQKLYLNGKPERWLGLHSACISHISHE